MEDKNKLMKVLSVWGGVGLSVIIIISHIWNAEYHNGNVDQLPGEPELAFSLRPTEGIDPEKWRGQKDKMVKL